MEGNEKVIHLSSFKCRLFVPVLTLHKLLSMCSAPPIIEASPFTNWELVNGHCCPVQHILQRTLPALSTHLPTPALGAPGRDEEDKCEENDGMM